VDASGSAALERLAEAKGAVELLLAEAYVRRDRAAPWQALRRDPEEARRIVVRRDDLRIRILKQRTETTTVFCVDASGSAALERLAEAKGAVELLLAEAYVRRDR
ncbi:hypothetical protein CTI14_58260, partial [Methylobacterium radiotolerans]